MGQIILNGLTVEQLGQLIADKVKEAVNQKEQSKKQTAVKEPKYLTRKETAKLLHISLPTLNEWTKEGILKSYRIGSRILYKPEEVLETVTQRNFTDCTRKI